jgi:hypothetical protein
MPLFDINFSHSFFIALIQCRIFKLFPLVFPFQNTQGPYLISIVGHNFGAGKGDLKVCVIYIFISTVAHLSCFLP